MMTSPIRFFDPHFHVWNLTSSDDDGVTPSGHDTRNILTPGCDFLFHGKAEYEAEVARCKNTIHEGGVFIEANSVCFVGEPGDKLRRSYEKEIMWTMDVLGVIDPFKSYRYQACAALESSEVKDWLAFLFKYKQVCGVRQIANYKPSWPRNDCLGDLLENENWKNGFCLLGDFDFAFDLQLNPSQFMSAVKLIRETPKVRIIIDHAGHPLLEDLTDTKKSQIYWNGMAEFAKCDHVSIKISNLCRIDSQSWDRNPVVTEAIYQLIRLFGVERVAFATNAPVDGQDEWPSSRVIAAFQNITANFTQEQRAWLFADAAKKMYPTRA